jgi:hypothetical protein
MLMCRFDTDLESGKASLGSQVRRFGMTWALNKLMRDRHRAADAALSELFL